MKRALSRIAASAALLCACTSGEGPVAPQGEAAAAVRRRLHALASAANAPGIVPTPIVLDTVGRYVMRLRDTTTFFTGTGLAFSLTGGEHRRWGVRCELVGARDGAMMAEQELPGRVHSYVGAAPSSDRATYARVVWEDAYPGIDMLAEPARAGVAYRFVASPGADLSRIVLRWSGATGVASVDGGRGLDVTTGIGVLRVRGLRAFALRGEQRVELPARHIVRGADVSLAVDGWDGRTPLVIDPAITWSSFLGGSGQDAPFAMAVDGSGNAVIAGWTTSADFPELGGFDTGLPYDAFVTKVSRAGTLLWSSYLGGRGGEDIAHAVAIDSAGDVFVVGRTGSDDFPIAGAFDTKPEIMKGFITKVSTSGKLLWSSYVGGKLDAVFGIAIDGKGDALIAGVTAASTFPTTGGFDTTLGGTDDGFVAKVSGAGAFVWGSYLGGSGKDRANAIAVDAKGDAVVVGTTESADFPTSGGFDKTLGGTSDGFVARVSGAGALLWSSYLGGSTGYDTPSGVATDAAGNALVTGDVRSEDFPIAGGLAATRKGISDAFVTKLSPSGALIWSTYLGGSGFEIGQAIAADPSGNAVVVGTTSSADFPTLGAFDALIAAPSSDAFVAKIGVSGTLLFGSFLGGADLDQATAVAIDASGATFIGGHTSSADFPTASGFDTTFAGVSDAFITRLEGRERGAKCTVASDCASGHCVDGVCCESACTGTCVACSAAKKGSGADGVCDAVASGTDPDNECAPDPSPFSCGADGTCDGAGACKLLAPAGTNCGAPTCSAGIASTFACDLAGVCKTIAVPCAPYACDATTCRTTCATDADCAEGLVCERPVCTPRTAPKPDDAGPSDAAAAPTPSEAGGCSCEAPTRRAGAASGWAPFVLALAMMLRTRRLRAAP